MSLKELIIHPKPPFNYELTLDFMLLGDGDGPFPERRVGNKVFRAFRIEGSLVPAIICFEGSVERPKVRIKL